jgi:hypothetical protein
MTGNPTAGIVAKKLVDALANVVASGVIAQSFEQEQLRDYLADAEDELQDVIVAFVGHTLAEVE